MTKKNSQFVIIFIGVLVFLATAWIVKTHIHPFSVSKILDTKDPILLKYQKHLENYNDETDLLVLFESQKSFFDGEDLWNLNQQAFGIYSRIVGVESVRNLYDQEFPTLEKNRLQMKSFFEKKELSEEGKNHLQNSKVFKFSFLDPTGHAAMMYLKLRPNLDVSEMKRVLEQIKLSSEQLSAKHSGIQSYVLGTEMARYYFMKEVGRSQGLILPLVLLIILGLLYFLFGSFKVCAISLFTMLMSYALTVSLIVIREGTINPFSSFALLFILVISTIDLVHFYSALTVTTGKSIKEKINQAMIQIYKPCLMCAITTWVGLLSLLAAEMPPIINFGLYCAFGVALCFFLTFHLMPKVLILFDVQIKEQKPQFSMIRIQRTKWIFGNSRKVILSFSIIVLVLGLLCSRLTAGDNLYRKFVADHPLSVAVDKFTKYFNFTGSIDITVNGQRGVFLIRESEEKLDWFETEVLKLSNVAHVKSFRGYQDLIRRMVYKTSDITTADFSKEIKLKTWFDFFDENEVFDNYLPPRINQTRLTVFLKSLESKDLLRTQKEIESLLNSKIFSSSFTGEVNGFSTLRSRIFNSIYTGFISSFVLDFIGIFLCFLFFFRSLKWAVVAMIPNLLPVLSIGAVMGAIQMTVDYNLIVLVAIIFGIAVDDTTHFLYHFLESLKKNKNTFQAVEEALENTSVALLGTTFIFCLTVPIFFLTNILMFSQVALILILALVIGVCADIYVLPALLFHMDRKKIIKQNKSMIQPLTEQNV